MSASSGDDRVDLTDLDVISRYSLAVRAASAPVDEVVAALRADLAWLEGLRRGTGARSSSRPTIKTADRTTAKTSAKAAAKKPASAPAKKSASTARTPAGKSTSRRGR